MIASCNNSLYNVDRSFRLLWRLGPCHLVEEAWPTQTVQQAFRLGPFYTGSYQTPVLPNGERLTSLVGEERVTFGLHARAVSQMTLARLRKVYNKIDGKAIAKQVREPEISIELSDARDFESLF